MDGHLTTFIFEFTEKMSIIKVLLQYTFLGLEKNISLTFNEKWNVWSSVSIILFFLISLSFSFSDESEWIRLQYGNNLKYFSTNCN